MSYYKSNINAEPESFKQFLADLSTENGFKSFLENNKTVLDKERFITLFESDLLNLTPESRCVFTDIAKCDEGYVFTVGCMNTLDRDLPETIKGIKHCYWAEDYKTFREAVIAFFDGCEEINYLLAEGLKYMSKTKELMSEYMESQNISADNRASNLDNVIEKANAEKNKTIVKVCTTPEINKSR